MYIYFILFGWVLLSGAILNGRKKSNKYKKFFLGLSFSAMILILGLRAESVGEDTKNYLYMFDRAKDVQWNDIFHEFSFRTTYFTWDYGYQEQVETGYLILNKFVHIFTDSGHAFLFVIALLTCVLFAVFIYKNSNDVFLSTYIFMCETLYMFAFNGMRQALALSIAIQAYSMIKDRKFVKAISTILLAFLIHNTAVICFAFFSIVLVKPKNETRTFKWEVVVAIMFPIVVLALRNVIAVLFPQYRLYYSTNYWINSLGGSAIIWIFLVSLIFVLYLKHFPLEGTFQYATFSLVYLSLQLTGLQITVFSRLGLYFAPFLLLLYPKAILLFSAKSRRWMKLLLFALMALLFLAQVRNPSRAYSFCF